jgi:hypothetical protein
MIHRDYTKHTLIFLIHEPALGITILCIRRHISILWYSPKKNIKELDNIDITEVYIKRERERKRAYLLYYMSYVRLVIFMTFTKCSKRKKRKA